jgi:hypothetical protein
VEVVEKKLGNGVRWFVVGADGETAGFGGNNARSLDCAESFAIANDSASLGMTEGGDERQSPRGENQNPHFWQNRPEVGHPGLSVGRIFACVDANEKWWLRLRGNPKRSGEISQAAFLLKAETMGFDVALPWGDNQKFDFVVWRGNGRAMRVQVKGTGRLHRRGYEVQPVHATRRGGKKRYSKKDIDVIAAHVQPIDAWYLIPIERVGRAKSVRLYPGIQKRSPGGVRVRGRRPQRWERWRDRWDLLDASPANETSRNAD